MKTLFFITKFGALAIVLVLALGLLPLPQARAQEQSSGLNMQAAPAYGGYFKYGEWLPVWVTVENSGADVEAEVRVRLSGQVGATTFAAPLALPAGARKRLPVYVLPNNFTHEMEIQLVSGKQLLATGKVIVNPQPNVSYLIGLAAPERGALSQLNNIALPGQNRPIVLIDMQLDEIPERAEGLRSLNTLVINNTDTSTLSTGQQAALEAWVRLGGRLVVGGGAEALRTATGLPESLLPFRLSGVQELETLPGLAEFAGGNEVRVPGPFVAATGEASGDLALARQNGLPLVLEWPAGKGFVDFVALDLAVTPFDSWAGAVTFWETLLSPGARYPEWLPYDMSIRQNRAGSLVYALSNLPSLDLPSIRGLAILLIIYVILVGPVNYLALRWRRRMHLAWVTIPLITLGFSAGAFGLGYSMRGTDLILNKIAIIETHPDGTAVVNSFLGLFSPARQSYEIEVAGGGLVSPLAQDYDPWSSSTGMSAGETTFVQGEPGRVMGLTVNQWSMQAFMTEGSWPGFGSLTGDLEITANSLKGSVRNDTAQTISDAVLVLGSQFVRLGLLAPGETKEVNLELTTLIGQPFDPPISYKMFQQELEQPLPNGPPRAIQLKQSVVDSLFPWGSWFGPVVGASSLAVDPTNSMQILVLGWVDQAPPEVRVAGRKPAQQATGLLVSALDYRLPAGEQVSLPPGFVPASVIEMNDSGFCGPMGMPAVYLGRQGSVFEFRIPATLQALGAGFSGENSGEALRVDDLLLYLGSDSGWDNPPAIHIFNWETKEWIEQPNLTSGRNVINELAGLISLDHRARVRLMPGNLTSGGCFYMAMGLDGGIGGLP